MNAEIVNAIVESYKTKGLSTHDLLKDPLFLSLPLEKQVEAVQAYAGVLAQNGKIPTGGKYIGRSILKGVTGGLLAALPLAFPMVKRNPAAGAAMMLGGATVGAGFGAVSGTLGYRTEKDRFEKTNKYLIHLSKHTNVPSAVQILDMNRKYEPKTLAGILKNWASPEQELLAKSLGAGSKRLENMLNHTDYYKEAV